MDPDLGPLPGRLGGGRSADGGLPGAAGDAADPRQRHGRPDRRGARRRPTAGRARPRARGRRTTQRHDRLSGRPARTLALGRQRPGRRGLRAVRGRRARSSTSGSGSPTIPSRCAAPSSGSRVRAGAWTARFASTISDEPRGLHWDTDGLLVVSYGFHTFGLDVATGEAALGPSLGDADRRAPRLVAAGATSSSRPRSRRSRSSRTGRSPGGSRTRTS